MVFKQKFIKMIAALLIFSLPFISSAMPVMASSATPALDVGSMISGAEWAENASTLLSEALEKYGALGAVAAENTAIVVGSAAFAYAATKGIEFAVDSSMYTAATLGRYIIANCADMSSEIQRTVASVITNTAVDANYYETKSMVYSSQLLSSLDVYLGNYISANTIAMNVGLTSQGVIPSSYLAEMTASIYELYEAMPKPIYLANTSYHFPFQIFSVPSNSVYVLINSAGTKATILDASGVQVIMTGIATSSYWLYYSQLTLPYSWKSSWLTSSSYAITGYDIDWGGLTVLQGDSYANAIGLTVDYPLGLDLTGALDIPLTITGDLVIPYTDAISIGTGNIALEDVADVTTDVTGTPTTDTGLLSGIKSLIQSIIDYLKQILAGILSIPTILTNIWDFIKTIPSAIADAISALLSALFVPTAECVAEMQGLLDEKLPFINDIYSWVDELMKIMQSPEDYASKLTFTVDMSKAENTHWNYGSSQTSAISATWYMKYKNTVDDIIVGIAWLIFLWNVHCQLPSIISAVSTTTFASANLEYQKYSVSTRAKKMNEAKDKERNGDS